MPSVDLRHVFALEEFVRDAQSHAERIEETKTPEVLTVDGRAALVVQDAESYHAMLDQIEKSELLESLRQGMRDSETGLGLTSAQARRQLRDKHGF